MDLGREVQLLRLDLLAADASRALTAAGIAHALLKGPSTRLWLRDDAHVYRDVDLLVAQSALARAREALHTAGVAEARAGRPGEEAEHSQLLLSDEHFELDLHFSLPALAPAGDRLWDALAPHVVPLDIGVATVPALDEPARCLVLALHALNSGMSGQAAADLHRALAAAPQASWEAARGIADRVGAGALLADALALAAGEPAHSRRAILLTMRAPAAAIGMERIAAAPRARRPLLLWREVLPSPGFLRAAYPDLATRPLGLPRAHLRRWRRILGQTVPAWRAWRRARDGG